MALASSVSSQSHPYPYLTRCLSALSHLLHRYRRRSAGGPVAAGGVAAVMCIVLMLSRVVIAVVICRARTWIRLSCWSAGWR